MKKIRTTIFFSLGLVETILVVSIISLSRIYVLREVFPANHLAGTDNYTITTNTYERIIHKHNEKFQC